MFADAKFVADSLVICQHLNSTVRGSLCEATINVNQSKSLSIIAALTLASDGPSGGIDLQIDTLGSAGIHQLVSAISIRANRSRQVPG